MRSSLIVGGPFHGLLVRLRFVGPGGLPGLRAGVVLAAVAWVPPAILAGLQDVLAGNPLALPYLADVSVVARFLVGVLVLVAIERQADGRLSLILDNFRDARLVEPKDLPALSRELAVADRRTSSGLAEGVMLVVALAATGFVYSFAASTDPLAWEGRIADGEVVYSWAGLAARWVSSPLFQFLVMRWVWRFVIWGHLLFRISRLPLRLSVTHPDRMGGLSFVSLYPPVFNGLLLAVSAALAASFIRDLQFESISLQTVQIMVGAWVLTAVVFMVGPLLVFLPGLVALKDNAVIRYGRLAGELHREFESRWLDGDAGGRELLASSDASAAADANAIVGAIWGLRVIPVELVTVISVAVAAGLPMLAVLATRMPIQELAERLVGALL